MRILFRDNLLVCKKLGEKDILHMTTKLETWRREKLPDPWFTMGSLPHEYVLYFGKVQMF